MKTKNIMSIMIALLILLTSILPVSAYEVRGTVYVTGSGTTTWTAQNFAGFYYDIDSNTQTSETLSINDNVEDRIIADGKLTYTTTPSDVNFTYSDEKGLPVYDQVRSYKVVGWQAEKWVALNNKPNKLVKLIKEFDGAEKATLLGGQTLDLGNGYILKIQSVDARAAPRQAWITVMKDGKNIDDGILQQNAVYNLRRTVSGESDALVFSAYVDSIFSGQESDMIQLKYIWLIDESSFTEIKSGDKFGVFEVTGTNPITLTNDGTISLSKNTDVTLMGNMKFKVADNAQLRFYPYVDITEDSVKIVSGITVVTPTPIVTATPYNCTPVEKIVEREVIKYVNVTIPTATPASTPALPAPGFDAIYAIVGLFGVAFLVLRQRK